MRESPRKAVRCAAQIEIAVQQLPRISVHTLTMSDVDYIPCIADRELCDHTVHLCGIPLKWRNVSYSTGCREVALTARV